jgi:hypothetical protein
MKASADGEVLRLTPDDARESELLGRMLTSGVAVESVQPQFAQRIGFSRGNDEPILVVGWKVKT